MNLPVIMLAFLLLAALLASEGQGKEKTKLVSKTALSCLFIVAALLQPRPDPVYFTLILAGLAFSLGGDVLLALKGQKVFLLGIFSFLVAHLFYILAFFLAAQPGILTVAGLVLTAGAGGAVFFWLRGSLGAMKRAVTAYILIISIMMAGAWSVLGDPYLNVRGRILVFGGALLFYLSDLLVARDRFVSPGFINRLIGLPLYYLGQFFLAFSVGLIG